MFYISKNAHAFYLKKCYTKFGRKKSRECGVLSFITRNLMFVCRPDRRQQHKITLEFDFILVVCGAACNLIFTFDQKLGFAHRCAGEK